MRMSAAHCREQEALHLAKAANEPLESRRKIAETAAKAWASEAALADKRAAQMTPLDALDTAITQEFAREDAAEADAADGLEAEAHPR